MRIFFWNRYVNRLLTLRQDLDLFDALQKMFGAKRNKPDASLRSSASMLGELFGRSPHGDHDSAERPCQRQSWIGSIIVHLSNNTLVRGLQCGS